MKRKFILAGVIASFLAFASALNGPVEAQVGIGRTTTIVSSDLTVSTADFALAGDDFFVGWGADNDFRLEFVSASDELVIKDDADAVVLQIMDFPGVAADYGDLSMVNIGAAGTIANMDGSRDYSIFQVEIVNGNHTGSDNSLNGIEIVGITGDAQATERALHIGAGWDQEIFIDGGGDFFARIQTNQTFDFVFEATSAARFTDAGTGRPFTINNFPDAIGDFADTAMIQVSPGQTIANMDGSDDYAMLEIDIVNGNHTGTGNTINLLEFTALTGDAEANLNAILIGALTGTVGSASEEEIAVNIAAGWDTALNIVGDGSATLNNIRLGATPGSDAQIYFDGADLVFDVDGTTSNGVRINIGATSAADFLVQNLADTNTMNFSGGNTAGSGGAIFQIAIGSIAELSSDTIIGVQVDLNDAEFDTATGSIFNFFGVNTFTPDSNVDYNGINIAAITGAAGAETGINIGSGWDTGIAINTVGTAALPALAFRETDDGFFSIGTNNLGLTMNGALVMDWEDTNAAGAGADLVTISSVLGIMDNSDTVRGLRIELTNANHTGTSNVVVGLDLAGITGDAEADELALFVGTGWDAAIHMNDNAGIRWEGATIDTEELLMQVSDPTADVTVLFRAGLDSADTYHVLVVPDGELTTGDWSPPWFYNASSIDADSVGGADNQLMVHRVFIPHPITIATVAIFDRGGVDSSTDDTLAFAIYEDADNGSQFVEFQSADLAGSGTAITFDITDTTLEPGWYRVAFCAQDVSADTFSSINVNSDVADIVQESPRTSGNASNPCVNGNPPDTTGSLGTTFFGAVFFKFQT